MFSTKKKVGSSKTKKKVVVILIALAVEVFKCRTPHPPESMRSRNDSRASMVHSAFRPHLTPQSVYQQGSTFTLQLVSYVARTVITILAPPH